MLNIQQIATVTSPGAHPASGIASALTRARTVGSARAAEGNGTSSSSSIDTTTVTANDFLTLLVAEMKNQDPTQPTDPSAYISQMVGVNSLQQLIGINQGVGALDAAIETTVSDSNT